MEALILHKRLDVEWAQPAVPCSCGFKIVFGHKVHLVARVVLMSFFCLSSFPVFLKLLFSLFCSVFHPTALSCFDFQGIPGEPGKRGKMGRPVKFCLNILYSQSCD